MLIAGYIETHPGSRQTIKRHLTAIKMLFDYLVVSQVVPTNPTAPVKGPTHMVKERKTPILSAEVARKLLDSIPTDSLQGLRDRVQTSETMIDLAAILLCSTGSPLMRLLKHPLRLLFP
ncbi:MAG: hypothetical protein WB586_28085 [Chthoniobacterales bacterium]